MCVLVFTFELSTAQRLKLSALSQTRLRAGHMACIHKRAMRRVGLSQSPRLFECAVLQLFHSSHKNRVHSDLSTSLDSPCVRATECVVSLAPTTRRGNELDPNNTRRWGRGAQTQEQTWRCRSPSEPQASCGGPAAANICTCPWPFRRTQKVIHMKVVIVLFAFM